MEKTPYTFILGGTRGLGAAIANECLDRGQRVVVFGHSVHSHPVPGEGEWERGVLPQRLKMACDLRHQHYVDDTHLTLEKLYNKQFGIVCTKLYWTSGMMLRCPFGKLEWHQIHEMLMVNLVNGMRFVELMMKFTDRGDLPFHLATIASTTGLTDAPREDEAVYAATKAAQVSFTRAIGKGSTDPKLKTALFCPGGMQTDFWKHNPGVDTSSFLDPNKVAQVIVDCVENQREPYFEKTIPRGSL